MGNARRYWATILPDCGQPGCSFVRRCWRRIRWWNGTIRLHHLRYCAPQCFEYAAQQRFTQICNLSTPVQPIQHRIPLGLLMLSRGQLSNRQLRSALEAQQASGCHRLGEWLEKLGFATEQQITTALGLQWACPVLTARIIPDHRCLRLMPFRILETYRMLPIQFVEATRTFYVAFSEDIDYGVLNALEQMLDCRTEACLVSRSTMDEALERIGRDRGTVDLLFEGWRHAPEMARITTGYVLKLGAENARIVACGCYIWVRLSAGREVANLIFRRPDSFQKQPAWDEPLIQQITG
jgi:hypothetical protein